MLVALPYPELLGVIGKALPLDHNATSSLVGVPVWQSLLYSTLKE